MRRSYFRFKRGKRIRQWFYAMPFMNNDSQKEKEAKRKILWVMPLMGKLMDNLSGCPQFPQSLGQLFELPTLPTITRRLLYCSFIKTQKPEVSTLVKIGSF